MVFLIFLAACKIPIDLKFQFILEGYFQLLLFVFQPNLNSVNKHFYKGLINKKILKWYVEQVELLKREYPFEEFGKILQG
ncbi:TPA: hypothetical protein QCN45_005081 [Bacillus cereus]|uniref:Uncharacterized protein n=1 Tax=Bacillus cereus TaxID=1396 RepID=A0A9X7A0P7_BACCE|nr:MULTISPECIES: hypothetical protein [Bacillus cereus group]MCI4054793.1 hypothetical protein [Bacillus cereus]MDA2300136.1 hypothetical protein [Bacillus cereus]MDA2305159.1 hypothetical protein [Bacillus cereus]MEC1981820.1 hypothetical protein [Bacillus cereus]PFK24553.1 hypothetical protein COI98_05460 [Bacillus cereus]